MQPTESLLRLPEVEAIVGLKKSKLYTLIQEGRFPQPVKLGTRSVRWKASTVYGWIDGLPSANITEEATA
jgi:prophage regulatory protein